MSTVPEDVTKLTENTYKNVMEQFNPGLRNLVNLGKSYEKAVSAMTLAGKSYFDAVSKIGELAAVSPVSRELGEVLIEISDSHKKLNLELEDNFKHFHKEIIAELEHKIELDMKYMNATLKKYQTTHRDKLDMLEKSNSELKKLRRKSQGKNATKYEKLESEYVETISSRQLDMQQFVADGCREALLEEKRRFCFLVDKHCTLTSSIFGYHSKAQELLGKKLPNWQDKCTDATKVPDTILTMIEGMKSSSTPQPSPHPGRYSMSTEPPNPPPAPALKAHPSPLVDMFNHTEQPKVSSTTEKKASTGPRDDSSLPRSVSVATGLNMVKRPRVITIFPHTAGSNNTLLSFQDGEIIILLTPEEKDGWLYGEHEKTKRRGWFPSSYCRPFTEQAEDNRSSAPVRSVSTANLVNQQSNSMILPPPDYEESSPPVRSTEVSAVPPPPAYSGAEQNGIVKPPFLGGGNPFATVKLRPTVTNDRSAPIL
ncbi:brain-specific angiogenesis inhibitor 1-associated protein 2-like protein 1 [Erpetoichthys calabaricus]|uniref:BAR/IMD domain-containing adapter protein 2-like 1 n=1 Tax=Erpetoichthys calabaricus TaxID=27687 RepID=A0A8C4TD87_ERPCA|nr:brain-specific angiogenesis inhibitor 1-associated protein 2-like protein 1 [Erpetoichthys calabaricus]